MDFDILFNRQSSLITEIEKIYNNFRKDSATRKTPDYINKRLVALDNLWGEFLVNDEQLETNENKTTEYYVQGVFSRIKRYYEGARSAIANYGSNANRSFEIPELNDSGNDELDDMVVQQRANFRALQRLIRRFDASEIDEKWEIEDALRSIQHRWNNIDELHLKIDSILQGKNRTYEAEFSQAEDSFENIKRQLNKKLCSTVHLRQAVPQVDIPVFTGKYTQWPTFNDLFTEAIHNNKYLSQAQKLQHLKGKLKGEAERLIQHLHISSENYDTAWEILNHRYNNPQVLFTKHIEILLNQPVIQKQSSNELKRLYDTTTECIHAIHNLGVDTNTWDPMLVHILSKKLDVDTYSDYKEARQHPRELPTLNEFMTFIEAKFTALEPINPRERERPTGSKQPYQLSKQYNFTNENKPVANQGKFRRHYQAAPTYTRKFTCPLCNLNHDLFKCNQFRSLPNDQVVDTIKKQKICPNCLYKHYDKACTSTKRCKECGESHNTLIHEAMTKSRNNQPPAIEYNTPVSNSPPVSTADTASAKQPPRRHANYVASDNEEILLTTLRIKIKSADNTFVTLRALLDQGSQVSLISERAMQMLGLSRNHYHASVSGIGSSSKQSKGVVTLECKSIYEDYDFSTQALVISHVINNLPSGSFKKQSWPHLQHLSLADPEYNVSMPVDLLLDASVYSDIIMEGLIKGPERAPIAQQTKLGWIVSGHVTRTFSCNIVTSQMTDLSKYWELEDIQANETSTTLSAEDQYCEQFYQSTTRCLEDGRYEVALPMKADFEKNLGSSKSKATAQFLQMERKMTKNESLSHAYKCFMQEYELLNHMNKVENTSEPVCYLPHHGVVKSDSTTTALRVVFNASSKTSSGHSLNDLMECGPNLQQDLQSLILRWRQYRYVLTADIEKMFRQIMIRPQDQSLQTILWRQSPQDLLSAYQLTTVTYGTKAAPYLAIRTLRQIAKDNPDNPLAVEALENSFYMDDLLSGHDTLEQAKELQRQLIEVLARAGMNLRKWSSNEKELSSHLSKDQLSSTFDFRDTETRKTLGLQWNPSTDSFTYQNKLDHGNDSNVTKRMILSDISKLYDPLGWLSPITIRGKILFQKTWLSEIAWDEKLPTEIENEWLKLKEDLKIIDNFTIPRYLGQTGEVIELHGFCDASEKAYACAIYIVAENHKGEYTSTLVTAKTRVAPVKKPVSLPRLELLGALLLAQLMKKVTDSLSGKHIKTHAWTDSMIVLGWLHGDLTRWKPFVANRVRQITDIIPPDCWRHVKSEENAADCATRGMPSASLGSHSLWWRGPTWLTTFNPSTEPPTVYQEPSIEIKRNVHAALQENCSNSFIIELLNKNNSITRVAKTIAWVSRFVARLRKAENTSHERTLTSSEVLSAYDTIIRTIQGVDFEHEISSLIQKKQVSNKSKLSSLNPFLDEKGILRVGGRLQHANLSYTAKHPIILLPSSRFTDLVIDQAHRITSHGGAKLTLSYIREKYWIISGIRCVKKRLRSCVKCLRYKQEVTQHIMADLPRPRVTSSRPFTNTGVDFTGHVDIKTNKGRGVRTSKGYIAVFVCLATKAVHLELVSDLSTATFLAAFRRMCARRGTPKNVFSDNGTNFVGANKELKKEYQAIIETINTDFIDSLCELEVTWHFNAPAWPSAGGLWEAAVKSLKYHLKRVLGEQKLTFEEFTTLLSQVEACLNSRPLCALTENIDEECLTPGHFLVGGPLISRPLTDPDVVSLSTRWQMVQAMNKQIWKRWSNEYLQQLQTRSKWRKQGSNIEIGDVVIIKDANMPPGKWAMARVCETHPGPDGNIRVVTLKTKNSIMKRPTNKLIRLPVNDAVSTEEKSVQHPPPPPRVSSQKPTSTLRPRKRTLKTFFITAMLIFMSIIPSSHQSFNITNITKNNNTLFFDKAAEMQIIKDEWNLVIYYNMTNYWESIENIEFYINYLKKSCKGEGILCSVIMSQFEHELSEIKHYNTLLTQKPQTRSKRGLVNAVGNVASALFGVLDDKFAEQYKQDIETLHENESHLLNLLKNQTSIIEAENNIIRRNEELMNRQFKVIYGQLAGISNDVIKIEKETKTALHMFAALSSAMSIDVIMSNLRRLQESLINTVTDIYQGRLDTHLMSPEQLRDQLNIISGQLKEDLSIPVRPENIREIYELLHVRAKVESNYLIIEVKIPLTTSAKYELDYIISLPQKANSHSFYVTPAMDYIAFNPRKDTFIPISANELLSCLHYQVGKLLCGLNAPIYELKIRQSICDVKIITHESNQTFCRINKVECTDRWVKLHASDSWLYSCCEECQVRIMCPDGLTSRRLHGAGIITLGQDCTVRGDTFTLQGHHDYKSHLNFQHPVQEINLMKISQLNEFINTSISTHFFNPERHEQNFGEIERKIDVIKTATISDVPSHHVHHYTMIYIIFTILCTIIIGALAYQLRKRKNSTNKTQEHPSEMAQPPRPPSSARPSTCKSMEDIYGRIRDREPEGRLRAHSVCDVSRAAQTDTTHSVKFEIPRL